MYRKKIRNVQIFIIVALIFVNIFLYIPYTSTYVDSKLGPDYSNYVQMLKDNCTLFQKFLDKNHKVEFSDMSEQENIGECYWSANKFMVKVDYDYWHESQPIFKKSLLYHELTHCFFNVDHSPNPNNYMFFRMVVTTEEELTRQVIQDIKNNCK